MFSIFLVASFANSTEGADNFCMTLSSTDGSAVVPRTQGGDVGEVPGRSSGQGRVAHLDQE